MKIGLYLLLICVFCITAQAQYGYATYTMRNGLTQNTVTCIFRDSKGFVWVGTQNGLNKFDGIKFEHFKYNVDDTNSLSDQYVTAIQEDSKGNIWVGTRNGLNKLNIYTNNFTRIYPNKQKQTEIQYLFESILADEMSNLYFKTSSIIYILKKNTDHIVFWDSLSPNEFGPFICNNIIYKVNSNGTFSFFNINTKKYEEQKNAINESKKLNSPIIFANPYNGLIWVINKSNNLEKEILFFDTKNNCWLQNKFNTKETIFDISFSTNNETYLATTSGILKLDLNENNKKISPKISQPIFNKNPVLCSYIDCENIMWVGYSNAGLSMYNPLSKNIKLVQPNKKVETIFNVATAKNNLLYASTATGVHALFHPKNNPSILKNKKVRCMAIDHLQHFWVAIENEGLQVFNAQGAIEKIIPKSIKKLLDNTILHIEANQLLKKIFIATKLGWIVYDDFNKEWTEFSLNDRPLTLCGTYVLHTFIDSKQRIWVSSNGGINVFDKNLNSLYKYYSNSDTVSHIKRTIITGVTEDLNHNIWIATLSNGIYKRTENGVFTHYNQKMGLSSNVVMAVLADSSNRIWIATSAGMNIFDEKEQKIMQLSELNGMPLTDFVVGSFKLINHIAYIGSNDGLVAIDTKNFKIVEKKLQPFISKVSINYIRTILQNNYTLTPTQSTIVFDLSTPTYINANNVVYQYRLKGFSNNWITLENQNRKIEFSNLPYGLFQLQVKCAENMHELNTALITVVSIYHQAPFWSTLYFQLPCIIFLVCILILYTHILLLRKLQMQNKLAEIEQRIYIERERISKDLHDSLGTYATAIKSNIIHLEKNKNSSSATMQQLKENAENMVSALRETIWVLKFTTIDAEDLSDRFKNLVNRINPNYPDISIRFFSTIQNKKKLTPNESINILRIMQETLTNSLKHAKCSSIKINFAVNQQHITIIIEDNGIGFDYSSITQGYGLQNITERAKNIEAVISVITASNKGTKIILKK